MSCLVSILCFLNRIFQMRLGTILLRHRQFFTIFDPYPPPSAVFLLLSIGKFGEILTPSPLKNADVLHGWSLTQQLINNLKYLSNSNCCADKNVLKTKVVSRLKLVDLVQVQTLCVQISFEGTVKFCIFLCFEEYFSNSISF